MLWENSRIEVSGENSCVIVETTAGVTLLKGYSSAVFIFKEIFLYESGSFYSSTKKNFLRRGLFYCSRTTAL